MNIEETKKQYEEIRSRAEADLLVLATLEKEQAKAQKGLAVISDTINAKGNEILDKDRFLEFFKKPYAVIPWGKDKALIAVPKFVKDFKVGWLWKETESFYIYQFDQYSAWLGDAPKELLDQINIKKGFELTVEGNNIVFPASSREAIKAKLKYHLTSIGDNEARITRGHIFDVIAESIENGCLPFRPQKVSDKDIRDQQSKIKLRPYQKAAVDRFLETGAVGVFHPTGAGKSFISLYLLDIIKGKKIIIVPTRTLIEQWQYYIETFVPHAKSETKIITYQGFRDNNDEYALTVYDECQRLPADTFSRLAVIKTKYRLGLSASPHREDGRESYIFALTGFPVGLNWQEYMRTVGKSYHPIYVHSVRSTAGKLKKLKELVDMSKKTLIFCDTIRLGKSIAQELGVPYIFGQTDNRLEEIAANRVVAVSRVADLGVSIKDLQRIVEVDFLFGSRQQELQRTGRLMHAEKPERHDIIMTEGEIQQYGKRLWALQEKGFTIKMVS